MAHVFAPPQTVYIDIPAGTLAVPCRQCGRDVYHVARPCEVRVPVEVSGARTFAPSHPDSTTQHDGQGVPHLARCHARQD